MTEAEQMPTWVGIDVSKADFHVSIAGNAKVSCIEQNAAGYRQLMESLPANTHVVLEASGGYERNLVDALHASKVVVSVVNPKRMRDFVRSLGEFAKTDRIDAQRIRQFGERMSPRVTQASLPEKTRLRELRTRQRQLILMRVSEMNRRDRLRGDMLLDLESHIDFLTDKINDLTDEINALVEQDLGLKRTASLLETVPGVGRKTSVTLLVELPELGTLKNKTVAALAGLAPFARQSGVFRGRQSIHGGRKSVRTALYMAVVASLRCNPPIKAMYDRLRAAGKTAKMALTACMRKLLVWLNAMLRDGLSWNQSLAETS